MSAPAVDASIGIAAIFAAAAAFSALALLAVHSPRLSRYRLRTPDVPTIPSLKKNVVIAANGALSFAIYLTLLAVFDQSLVHGRETGIAATLGQALAVLLLYDLMYYAAHRCMHARPLMRLVHGVHHKVRFPTAFEGLYLHPLDNLVGVGLLFVSAAVIGPVGVAAFLTAAALHTFINIVTHTNLAFPHPLLGLTNHWAVRHDIHHGSHTGSNFASIFSFLDRMFGTYR